ncbi:MAG TPA: hypothetical protein VIM00_02085 [Candidatus Acidoferrum sp.]|jgi:hypothetical protein
MPARTLQIFVQHFLHVAQHFAVILQPHNEERPSSDAMIRCANFRGIPRGLMIKKVRPASTLAGH